MGLLTSCAYDPSKLTPEFIDTVAQTCRVYKVTQTKPTIEFEFDAEYPIAYCNGHMALPVDQAQGIRRYYEQSLKPSSEAPILQAIRATTPIQKELNLINGIPNPGAPRCRP